MRYNEFREALKIYTVFSVNDIRKVDSRFHVRRLIEWRDKGYIKKIIRGYYVFADLDLDENVLFEIANRIYSPSYISFEMALSYYQMIPESVYGLTSATSRKTMVFKTNIGDFIYHTIRPCLLFGYKLIDYNGRRFKVAEPEKALLDYFYINTSLKSDDDFAGMRIAKEQYLTQVDERRFVAYLNEFRHKSLAKRVKSFMEYVKDAQY
jgi:predicted transcriptional regulator of viral defense system